MGRRNRNDGEGDMLTVRQIETIIAETMRNGCVYPQRALRWFEPVGSTTWKRDPASAGRPVRSQVRPVRGRLRRA